MLPAIHTITPPTRLRPFMVTYDLHKDRDYRALHSELRRVGAVRLCESLWLANLVGSAAYIRRELEKLTDGDDSIAVIELAPGADWATIRVSKAAADWLSANITMEAMAA